MRIGFDAHVLDGRDQGTKTLMLRLINQIGLRHPDVETYVYCTRQHPEMRFDLPNVRFCPVPEDGVGKRLLGTLPALAKRDRLDTMVFNYITAPFLADATVFFHDILPVTEPRFFSRAFHLRSRVFFTLSSLRARTVLTVSDYSKTQIERIFPWTRRKNVGVIHIGPSFERDVYFGQGSTGSTAERYGRYALCVGRIEPRKNVQMAIDAVLDGAPADVKLLIVGRREPGIAIDTRGDPRIIELTGISDAELVDIYRGAALFLYPSSAEGFGLPLLDGLLFGLPVISSSRTSMAEVGEGLAEFFDPEDAHATQWLTQRVAAHFANRPVGTASPAQRHDRAVMFSWERSADEVVDAIRAAQRRG